MSSFFFLMKASLSMQGKASREHAENVSIVFHGAVSGRLTPQGAFRVWGKILIGFLGNINPGDRSYAYRDLNNANNSSIWMFG